MADRPTPAGGRPPESRRSFFEVYKRNQGSYTRWGTALGAGVIIAAGADFLYRQLAPEANVPLMQWLQLGITLAALAVLGLLLWYLVGVSRKSCDFMISTEGEMKKVSWSGRRELIGSTKVVILFTVVLSVILFLVDISFMAFFNSISVLRGASVWETVLGK